MTKFPHSASLERGCYRINLFGLYLTWALVYFMRAK